MTIPFITQNSVVFECRTGTLHVGDLVNDPVRYVVSSTGICHLPASAIVPADNAAHSFSVDNAQIFFIDSDHYETIATAVSDNGNITPNHDLYAKLRALHKTQFGYVVAGELFDCPFDSDGTFALDLSQLREGLPDKIVGFATDEQALLRRIISSMNTLVCASCFSAEIMSHPELGGSPVGPGKKKDWSLAMANHAIASGWTAIPEEGGFGEITPLCPVCKTQRES